MIFKRLPFSTTEIRYYTMPLLNKANDNMWNEHGFYLFINGHSQVRCVLTHEKCCAMITNDLSR